MNQPRAAKKAEIGAGMSPESLIGCRSPRRLPQSRVGVLLLLSLTDTCRAFATAGLRQEALEQIPETYSTSLAELLGQLDTFRQADSTMRTSPRTSSSLVSAASSCDNRRLAQLLPSLVEEFDGRRCAEEISACADAVLTRYDDAPVRSFLLTLADRATRRVPAGPTAATNWCASPTAVLSF